MMIPKTRFSSHITVICNPDLSLRRSNDFTLLLWSSEKTSHILAKSLTTKASRAINMFFVHHLLSILVIQLLEVRTAPVLLLRRILQNSWSD
jgi:hypothetical protein